MHKLTISLFVFLVFLSCQTETDELAKKRQDIVNLTLTARDVVDAKWEGPELLVITLKQDSQNDEIKIKDKYGKDTYVDIPPSTTAFIFASHAMRKTGIPVCAKVVYPDGQELAYRCSQDVPNP